MVQLDIPTAWLANYGLLLLRTSALVLFVPLPGARQTLQATKVALALMLGFVLAPSATVDPGVGAITSPATAWLLAEAVLAEVALGASLGVAYRLVIESFSLAAQILGFQAGYSYVNMVDPTSQVDASILNVVFGLLASLLFFAFDLHLFVIRALAESLGHWPLGTFAHHPADAQAMVRLGGHMIVTATRLALPVMAVLLLIDLTLGLLNQVHNRMQLLTLAFPAKIVAAVAVIPAVLLLSPRLFHSLSERAGEFVIALISR